MLRSPSFLRDFLRHQPPQVPCPTRPPQAAAFRSRSPSPRCLSHASANPAVLAEADPTFIAGQKNNWLVVSTLPSEKIWVRQLGWWHSQYMKKCSKSPTKQVFFFFRTSFCQHGVWQNARKTQKWMETFFFCLLRFSIFLSFPSTQIDPKRRDAPH